MNITSQPKRISQKFDIHAKLKAAKSYWSYAYAVQLREKGFNYQFHARFVDETEFAVYELINDYFVLVDFFKSYDEACDDAKKIIDKYPDIKNMLSGN